MKPVIHETAFVADNATVRGSVTLGANSSVFFGAVLRGDRAPITIGAGTNIQDNCVVHVDYDHPMTGFFMAAPRKSFPALYHNFPGKSTVTVKFVLTFFVRICYTDVR